MFCPKCNNRLLWNDGAYCAACMSQGERRPMFFIADNKKVCNAKITQSQAYYMELSLRDRDGKDIRKALKEAGFSINEKVVIISEEDYKKLILEAGGE